MVKRVRTGYPSDVTDEEWAFVAPYLALCREDAAQRDFPLREVFNGLRYMCQDRLPVAYDAQRSAAVDGGVSADAAVDAKRAVSRSWSRTCAFCCASLPGAKAQPTAMILDSRTLQSTPESGARAGYDGAKRRKGSKVHAAVDTLGHLLALHVTAADQQDRAQVEKLAEAVQEITGENIELAYVDQGYTGENAAEAAEKHGVRLEVVKHTEAKRGFVLLPRRWVVERSFAWAARFRRLARDYERLAKPWPDSTTWSSPSSCSQIWSGHSPEVNNRL